MKNTQQRRKQILQMLVKQGRVRVSDLVTLFGVSSVTIRGDLGQLEEQGLAERQHGSATLVRTPPQEQSVRQRDSLNSALKEAIGTRAAQLVRAGDNIIIDSGTTTVPLARHLLNHRDVTVMTNGLNIAWELANSAGVEVILTGGKLRKQSLSFQGAQAEDCLDAYSFDTLFLGVDGLDLAFGLTTHHEAEAALNRKMVERAQRVIVLCDSSKFGRVSLHRIALLERVDTIITDPGLSDDHRDSLAKLGIELLIAEPA